MNTLILKLGAAGDVVRTTPLLRKLGGSVTWVTSDSNVELLDGIKSPVALRVVAWSERRKLRGERFDLVICLEDDEAVRFTEEVRAGRRFGSYSAAGGMIAYTRDASDWFDLSLISVHGRKRADQLKLENRRSYQELLFAGLGFEFLGEEYLLPETGGTDLHGDVALAPVAGRVWPMKNWAYYGELRERFEAEGWVVNELPKRRTLREHLADVRNHRCLVSGDSLPMHLALGSHLPCVSLFTCTSPWEIYDYGLLTKIISPLLSEYFYQRGYEERATRAIEVEEVFRAAAKHLGRTATLSEARS